MKLSEVGGDTPEPTPGPAATSAVPPQRGGPPPAKLSEEGQPSMLESMWQGLLHGGGNVVMGARQMGSRIPGMPAVTGETPQAADAAAQQRQKDYMGPYAPGPGERLSPARANPISAGVGEFGGEMGATAPLQLMSGGSGLLPRLGRAALAGAAGGALQPVVSGRDFWTEKATQAGLGAAVGGAMGGAGAVMSPRLGADAAGMAARGIGLTPGMRGGMQGAERTLQAFPILGGFVEGKVGRSIDDFNRAAVRQALEPVGVVMPRSVAAGHDMMKFMTDGISQKYDQLLPRLAPLNQTNVSSALSRDPALTKLMSEMAPDDLSRLQKMIDNRITGRFDQATGEMPGPLFKEVDRDLGKRASDFAGTNSSEIGEGLRLANKVLRDELANANPTIAPYLKNIDNAWAMSVRLRDAASLSASSGGKFSPSDMLQALKNADVSAHHTVFAQGDALMQAFAEQANRVMARSMGRHPYDPGVASLMMGLIPGAVGKPIYAGLDMVQRHPALGEVVTRSGTPAASSAAEGLTRPREKQPRRSIGGP